MTIDHLYCSRAGRWLTCLLWLATAFCGGTRVTAAPPTSASASTIYYEQGEARVWNNMAKEWATVVFPIERRDVEAGAESPALSSLDAVIDRLFANTDVTLSHLTLIGCTSEETWNESDASLMADSLKARALRATALPANNVEVHVLSTYFYTLLEQNAGSLNPSDITVAQLVNQWTPPATVTCTHQLPAVRTNLLLPLLNVGLEYAIDNRWSVGADWYYPWLFRNSGHKNCFQGLGLGIEGRYWLGKQHASGAENIGQRLLGHSVGAFVMTGKYDLEHNYEGYQGEYILGGIDYLFAKPICRGRLHLELSLGVGYFHSRATSYQVYEHGGKGYRDKDFRKNIKYFGPLKAAVTLMVPLYVTRTKNVVR